MSEIGYGQCRQHICLMVKKLLEQNKRPNPFTDNLPGKDWWHDAFLKRHPQIGIRTPQALETSGLDQHHKPWTNGISILSNFCLHVHDLIDKPSCIWNCGESSFAFSPKSRKVLAPLGAKTVYSTGSGKGQITTWYVPMLLVEQCYQLMHVFPGTRFSYNPMKDCTEGA